jgi:hypothetical protein
MVRGALITVVLMSRGKVFRALLISPASVIRIESDRDFAFKAGCRQTEVVSDHNQQGR